MNIQIVSLETKHTLSLFQSFSKQPFNKSIDIFKNYSKEQEDGKISVLVALLDEELAGYITLSWNSKYQCFLRNNIPEIMDLNVLPKYRGMGIGSKLLQEIEKVAKTRTDKVGVGVGLYNDYGLAQRLYIKSGYIPDGNGATYNYEYVDAGSKIIFDDDLVLWFTKKLDRVEMQHLSAKSSHYDKEAFTYDLFNEEKSLTINKYLGQILKQFAIETVLDFSCGTGSQAFYLANQGLKVIGCDINLKMLQIAKQKAQASNLDVTFSKGDMRTTKAGEFGAVITIFNSIGHLTKSDFIMSVNNIHTNLKTRGLYIFDIFNLDYLFAEDNITKLTIDWLKKDNDKVLREIQYSTINEDGVLASYDIYQQQDFTGKNIDISNAYQTLQVYSSQQLKDILEDNGFEIITQSDIDGSALKRTNTNRILTIARKN